MEIETTLNVCNFYSTDCKGKIRTITENTNIPLTKKEIILVGMKLCQTHYNRFIVNEAHNLEYNKSCSHPKHDIYKTQSKNENKKSKLNLKKVPTRLIEVLGLDEFAEICSMCRKKTDKDPEYLQAEEYNAPIFKKENDDNILNIGNHTYSFRKDVLYSEEELKQFESDYQEIITQLTISNIGLSVSRRTVNRQKTHISENHQYTVNDYCLQNIENMLILNIDDYHNIHRRNQPTLLKTHDINHFVTILLNSNPNIPKIPYYSLNRIPIHNPKGVDFKLIIDYIDVNFMSKLGKSYYQQNEMWKQYLSDDSYENKLEFLTVHNYDGRVQNQQELRSMKNSKLVDFILHPLHSTKDYIESSNILFKVFEKIEQEDYLNNFVIPTICDWPGQVNLRRAITLRLNKKENSGISPQILSIIPMIGPLHISLNSRETLFQQYHFFFEMIYHDLFGANKILAQKPKPRLINLILNLTFYGWKNIQDLIINRFGNIKDVEYLMMIDLLDNSLPLTLDIYVKLFRCGFFEGYLESIIKIWILFQRLHRHNYNKAPLIFLSDVFYWTLNDHPILDILKNNLPIFNDYFVENFHSSLRYQTAESNTDKQIIQKA